MNARTTHLEQRLGRANREGRELNATAQIVAEMIAEGIVHLEDRSMVYIENGHSFLVEIKVFETTR